MKIKQRCRELEKFLEKIDKSNQCFDPGLRKQLEDELNWCRGQFPNGFNYEPSFNPPEPILGGDAGKIIQVSIVVVILVCIFCPECCVVLVPVVVVL